MQAPVNGIIAEVAFRSPGSKIPAAMAPYCAVPKHLVLLPGLDGTGELFADFVAALPQSWTATTVAYPTDRFLPYMGLRPFVSAAVPQSERFVLVAESFSTPLAVWYAATKPRNLDAVVICAGFVGSPVYGWSGIVKAMLKPWLFRLRPPRFMLEYFLLGRNAPPELLKKLRRTLHTVGPDVLSGRVREALHCDARDDLRRTTVPLLYLDATYDRLLSSSCKKEFSHLRPDIQFGSIPAPHFLLQREPQKAATVVMAFIKGLPPGAV